MQGGSAFSIRREAAYVHARCVQSSGMISPAPDFKGTYTTDLGPLSLTQKGNAVTGEFEWTSQDFREWSGSGTIVGTVANGVLTFTYTLTGGDAPQRGRFALAQDGVHLLGVIYWVETSDDMAAREQTKIGPWNGTKN